MPPTARGATPRSPSARRSCAASPSCTASGATSSPRSSSARWASRSRQREGEVDFAADITEYYADNAEKITGDQPLDILGEGTAVIRRTPIGVLLGIMPWNFPYYQVARFAAPNLVLGNTIILKHASQCPESAAAIEQIHRDAGLPEGAYTNIYATNEQAATVIADRRVEGVSITGSERAGAAVAEVAGRNLKKVALELGGSDPFILLSTDDLDGAVNAAVEARMDNNGQSCNAPKRFIVVGDLYEPFLEKFTAAMAASKMGDPFAEDTVLGPLSSVTAAERLQEQIDKAVAQGARLVAGGTREGAYFAPTVLTDVTPDMDVYREELFGPAGVVYRAADEDEAVAHRERHDLRPRLVRLHDGRGAGRARRRQDRGGHGLRQRRPRRLAGAALRRREALRHLARDGPAGGGRVRQQEAHPHRLTRLDRRLDGRARGR